MRVIRRIDPSLFLWLLGFWMFFGILSLMLGGDATPDFRIYHNYNGFAAIVGGRPGDLVAAQEQTYLFPGVDAFVYAVNQRLNDFPAMSRIIFALPNAIEATLVFSIAETVLPLEWPLRRLVAGAATLFGCTGAASLPTLATTMSEMIPGVFAMLALRLWLARGTRVDAYAGAAGLAAGIAMGLKLTNASMFAGILGSIYLGDLRRGRTSSRNALIFIGVAVLAMLLVAGWWWLRIFQQYGDPLFPFFNNIFRSDLVAPQSFSDPRWKPENLFVALFYPAFWAFAPTMRVSELNVQDPRVLLEVLAALAIAGFFAVRRDAIDATRESARLLDLTTAVMIGYIAWEAGFGYYRYVAIVETLSGVVIIGAVSVFAGRHVRPVGTALAGVVFLLAAHATSYPWWSRTQPSKHIIDVSAPAIAKNSMVLMLDPYAYSYLVPFFPSTIRFVGADTNLVRPGIPGRLEAEIESTIRGYPGPFWGFEDPIDYRGVATQILAFYGLKRTNECVQVKSNIEDQPRVLACRLTRR